MKTAVKRIIIFIGRVMHIIFPYHLQQKLSRFKDTIYTAWIKPNFSKIGKNTKIERGLYLVNGNSVEIGNNCIIGRNSFLTALRDIKDNSSCKIKIGNDCLLGSDIHITAANYIEIGNNVRSGKSILITDNSHGDPQDNNHLKLAPNSRPIVSKGPVFIGDNVWIGEKVAIMPGVRIGNGVIIGANSVVTKDIPDNAIAGGVPAKILKLLLL